MGILEIEPNPPILFNFLLPLFSDEIDMKLTNLSAASMLTPLFISKGFIIHKILFKLCIIKYLYIFLTLALSLSFFTIKAKEFLLIKSKLKMRMTLIKKNSLTKVLLEPLRN